MRNAVIAGYVRSPFTPASKGELRKVRPDELISQVVKGLIDKTGIDANDIEDLILGCAFPEGEQGLNMARLVVFQAGLPLSVAGGNGQPVLRVVHVCNPHGGGSDPDERRRGLHLRRS